MAWIRNGFSRHAVQHLHALSEAAEKAAKSELVRPILLQFRSRVAYYFKCFMFFDFAIVNKA